MLITFKLALKNFVVAQIPALANFNFHSLCQYQVSRRTLKFILFVRLECQPVINIFYTTHRARQFFRPIAARLRIHRSA